jgi:hypothetical protein
VVAGGVAVLLAIALEYDADPGVAVVLQEGREHADRVAKALPPAIAGIAAECAAMAVARDPG